MRKLLILLPRKPIELGLMLARIHLCIKLAPQELPIGRVLQGFITFSQEPCKDPTMYDIEVTSTTTIEDIIRKLKEEIYELTGEEVEVKLYDEEVCVLDKETKRPIDHVIRRKAISIIFYIIDNEPAFAEVYDFELNMRYEITSKTKLRELLDKCKPHIKK
jgi:hypothetical protein